jgi:tetratricopeptide (TPR) repeat protein
VLVLTAGLLSDPARAGSLPTPGECAARFAADPEAEASSSCFLEAAREPARKEEAIRLVEDLLRDHPRNAWLPFYLGGLLWSEPARSETLYAVAADRLAERGIALGEVRACSNRFEQLVRLDRMPEAEEELRRARGAAETSRDPVALTKVRMLEASYLINRHQDLPQAYRLLQEARRMLFPGGSYPMRKDCLTNLAGLAVNLGRLDEGRKLSAAAVDLTTREGDLAGEALARYNLLRAERELTYLLPRPDSRTVVLDVARRTLAVAEAAGFRQVQGYTHGILGLLTRGPESERHFQLCEELAGTRTEQSYCRSQHARLLTPVDPQLALRRLDEALDLAKEADAPVAIAFAWRERMRVSWRLGPPEQAMQESLKALTAIELLRKLEAPTEGREEIFTLWAGHYHWLAGRLLQEGEAGNHQALGTAFVVQERMRARALIDSLAASAVPAPARTEPGFATLDQVRQALAPDEALLSFQIAPWKDMVGDFAGGAWLTVVTRDGATVHPLRSPLAERTRLRPAVEIFSGLFVGGSGDDGDAAAALYDALLADGLAGLGPGIQRLVVVPDDVLHLLPFAALRPDPGAAPLVSRYEITLTPSATLWLQWRQDPAAASGTGALVLANPVASMVAPTSMRSANPASLGPLPGAQREGEAVLRHLGASSRLLAGPDATEAYLKSGPAPYGILHLATHAWTSDNEPDRSFVLLAPGSSNEDGRLHPREIAGLDLHGRIVVLSVCSSAAGEILRGEGVMGLARAFFQAGAHTVVATLWPLRDDEGAALFDRFYRHLGNGMSVAAALHAAQQDRMADGAPPAAWAGVIVLGDGGRVPVPGGQQGLPGFAVPLVLAACALIALLALAWRRVRK